MRDTGRKGRSEALDYMQSMLGEMRVMAKAERYGMLAYLIEMAYIEASDLARAERVRRATADPGETALDDPD